MKGNLYLAQAGLAPDLHPCAGPCRADVCVIGGGFTGLSAALTLAERGARVILLEAGRLGGGASGRNGGQLIRGLRWSWRDLRNHLGHEWARGLHAELHRARTRLIDRITHHQIACDFTPGHFAAAHRPAAFRALVDEADYDATHFGEADLRIVPPERTSDHLWSYQPFGGVYDPLGGHFQPLAYARGLARAAAHAGVVLHEHSPALSIDEGPRKVTVRTPNGVVTADRLILACDGGMAAIAPDLGRFTIPILNWQVATMPLGEDRARALLPTHASVADTRFVVRYFRLSADHRLIFAGGERYVQRPPRDLGAMLRPYLAQTFPSLAQVPFEYGWGGRIPVTMNRLPHFGRKGRAVFAHGFSGHGALFTTRAGELLAEATLGPSAGFDLFARLPHRPFPGGRWLARPLATAGLIGFALRDRL